jgi:predicted xylose isomerase-like sugar epimerase
VVVISGLQVVRQGIQLLVLFPVHDAPRTSEIAQEGLRTALDRLDDLLRDAT